MVVDENTGLVKVPEDMFWRITHSADKPDNELEYRLFEINLRRWVKNGSESVWSKKLFDEISERSLEGLSESVRIIDGWVRRSRLSLFGHQVTGVRVRDVEWEDFVSASGQVWEEYLDHKHEQAIKEDEIRDLKAKAGGFLGDYGTE